MNCDELIKKYYETHEKLSPKKKEKKIDWDENEEFEVDRILEVHFRKDGKKEFLVSWKGYSQSESSWEPEENLNCKELIEKFLSKVNRNKESLVHELREKRKATDRFTLDMYERQRRLSRRLSGKQRYFF